MRKAALPLALALLLAAGDGASAKRREVRSCAAEIGIAAARSLARDCRDADPATPALCRPETPCEGMRQMIADGCRGPSREARPVCREYGDEDEDEDE